MDNLRELVILTFGKDTPDKRAEYKRLYELVKNNDEWATPEKLKILNRFYVKWTGGKPYGEKKE